MKRILIAAALALAAGGQALAADLPQPAPPPPRAPATYVPVPVPVFSWTGIYVGFNGGYAFGTSNWNEPGFGTTGNFDTSGFLAGGTIGGNYQWGQFVLGAEGDWDWADLTGSACGGFCTTKSDWLGTARVRAGYAWDRILFYGTGGPAVLCIRVGAAGERIVRSDIAGRAARRPVDQDAIERIAHAPADRRQPLA